MSADHSLILFEGDVSKKLSGIFDCFGLKLTGSAEQATGLAEIWEFTGWPRKGKPRNFIHKAVLNNGMWTAVLDREMTMILDQENCVKCARKYNIKIFGYMIESVSGSCAMYYYTPEKVRGLNIQNWDVLENFGEPLPQEEGISMQDMLGDGAMRISRKIGFADSLFAHPSSRVLVFGMEDPQRGAADQERSGIITGQDQMRSGIRQRGGQQLAKPAEKHEKKPWWKFW